jgi:3-oxoadipate enol-lactonase
MRDVTLWAFTTSFFEERAADAAEFETAMKFTDQPVHAYLAQLSAIQTHDTTARLGEISVVHPGAGTRRTSSSRCRCPGGCTRPVKGSEWATTPGGHACVWEHPAPFNEAFLKFVRAHGKGN